MEADELDLFLLAEQQANELVDVLTQLKTEIESYSTARIAVDRAAEGVSGLAAESAEAVRELSALAETLRTNGPAEILRQQKDMSEVLTQLQKALEEAKGSILAGQERGAQDLRTELDQGLARLKADAEALQQSLGEMQEAIVNEHGQQFQSLREELTTLMGRMIGLRNLAIANIGLWIVILILLVWIALTLARG